MTLEQGKTHISADPVPEAAPTDPDSHPRRPPPGARPLGLRRSPPRSSWRSSSGVSLGGPTRSAPSPRRCSAASSPAAAGRSCSRRAASCCSRSGWPSASYGRIPLGRDDEAPEFRTVSWIAMMFSAGMGIGLMFYGVGRAAGALHLATAGHRRGRDARGPRRRDGHHALPLDAAPLGDLRRRRPRHRLRHLPPRPPAADQLGVRAAVRAQRGTEGGVRPGRRHPGDLRDAVRLRRLARPRRAADRRRTHRRRLHGQRRHDPAGRRSSRC